MRKIKRINTVCVFHSIQLAFRSWRQKRTIRASGAHLSFFSCLFLRISLSVRPSLDLVEMFNACRMVKCCNQGQKRYLWSCRHPLLTRQMFTWGHSGLHIEPSDQQQSAHHRKISRTYFGKKMVACRPHDVAAILVTFSSFWLQNKLSSKSVNFSIKVLILSATIPGVRWQTW